MERENIYKGSTFNMKCQYCGAVLNLTDEVCPHCGRKNRAGEAYKKDYDKYQSKVNTAEKSISAQQLYTVKVLVRGVAIAVLLAMFIGLVVYMLTHDWYFIKQKNAVSEYDTVTATLDRYWENEDYYDFFNYSDSINISGWSDGSYLDYHPQIEAAQIYIFVNNYISEYLAADNIFYKNKALTDICGLLGEFYDLDNLHYIYGKLAVGDTSDEKVEQIYKNMDAILKTYFYVSDEQVQAIRTADSTQIQLIIEESVKNKYE